MAPGPQPPRFHAKAGNRRSDAASPPFQSAGPQPPPRVGGAPEQQAKVRAAFLVAPTDVANPDPSFDVVRSFAPVPMTPLPFPTLVVASRNDSRVAFAWAEAFARAWGAELADMGELGHMGSDQRLGVHLAHRSALAWAASRHGWSLIGGQAGRIEDKGSGRWRSPSLPKKVQERHDERPLKAPSGTSSPRSKSNSAPRPTQICANVSAQMIPM
ncbi:RBBP9/YdeN family alpha/beta hydrolase [Azospirillum doebereinerae]